MTDIQGPWTWERNGNFQSHYHSIARMMEDEGCGLHDMDGCPLPPSNNFHCSEADWNSNKFVNSIEKKTDQAIPDSNLDCCTCKTYSDSEENHNKGFLRDNSTLSPNSPTSIFTASLHHKDISYDDLSKNIDANLAEIDMETFRSEDINSILALPAIYSGDFQSASHGEQCASVSGSLLNGLELDSSVSPRNSEDEISICKDEPLFSPLKEPPVPESTISVDSLDSSSIYDHDFVLTCQANKNNYTIVFEGSGTQFSDDSDYQEVCGSSEGESSVSGATQLNHRSTCYGGKGSSMVQSDLVFTTWSKLRRTQRGSKRRSEATTDFSTKSQSLPNLSHHSVFITDKHLAHWATWRGNNCLPLYDIQSCHSNGLQIAHSKDHAHSVSLLKLFMKHKIPVSNSLEISSSHSDSSSSIIIQPLNVLNSSLETSLNWSNHKSIQENAEGNNQVNRKNKGEVQIEYKNDNETVQTQLLVDNIKLSDWNSPQNVTEANNNTINSLYSMDNNNVSNHNNWKEETLIISDGEYDNSQYFEDSLVEVPVPQLKVFQTMPIKEEEETDISSGDETMKDSRNPFASDNSSLDDGAIIQNNAVDCVTHGARHEWSNNLERINNIFPTGKSNVLLANETSSFNEEEKLPLKKVGFCPENQSQSTQTKQYNTKECTPIDEVQFPQTTVTKTSSNQTDGDTLNNVCYSLSRDSSPTSSGYASSRHSSVERIRRTSQAFNCNTNTSSSTVATSTKKSNVMLTTTRTCSTQIPVHVKDIAMQTSLNSASNSYVGFTLKDSDEHIIETDHILEASSKLSSENSVASAEELQQKKKKSIYVCYPNYSLPDLSFLKGVIDKEPEAIYLTPTKYKLPQEIINHEKLMRPKSYAGFEAFSEKHLTNIKDWESLNVLLPDNLKHLISQMHAKSSKPDTAFQMDGSCKSKLQQTPPCSCSSSGEIPVFSPSSSSNASDTSCKKHIPRSILRKSSSVGHCEDKCHIYLPPRCSSASSVDIKVVHMKSKQQKVEDGINTSTHVYKISQHSLPGNEINKTLIGSRQKPEISHNVQPQLCNATFVPGTKSFSPNSLLSENPQNHVEKQQSPACFDPLHCHSAVAGFDGHYHKRMTTADITVNEQSKVPFCHYRNQELLHKLNGKLFNLCPDCNSSKLHSTESIQNQLHTFPSNKAAGLVPVQKDIVEENNFHHDPAKGKKAVKFCEKSPMKKTDYSDACMYNDPEEEPCCSSCIQYEIKERNLHEGGVPYPCDDDLDSENPPQEFVVSPTQGSSPFSPPSDFYFMQNSAGGGSKLFQEALRKKTGLVENLQKATEIISEHFQVNGGKKNISQISNNADFLTGQKILACLCPAVHTILSDGLLPTVQGFFGPLPNTPWKVAEASVQQGESRKEVQDLLAHVNAEKLLTDSTYRFNAFIIGLLNLHCLDWWIGHLCTCQSLICHHYHPTALLSLLALPAATHLRQELKELVSPLSNLPFELDLTYETRTTTGDTWSLGNRVRKNADENVKHDITISTTGAVAKNGDRRRITDLTFRLPPYIDNEREHDVNFKERNSSIIDLLIPAKAAMNIKESPGEYQEQVWPGITINPFPNIKISEEQTLHDIHNQPKGSKDHYNVNAKLTSHLKPLMLAATSHGLSSGHQRNCVKNENESKEKEVPELSLCSSTDSGCSSQAEHSRQTLQAAAKPGAALPTKTDSKEKDGQQFKKLRQKWEKMTLGMDKQSNSKGISQKQIPTKAPFANHSKTRKKPSESVKINRSGSGSPSNRDAHPINHTHREASHSPTGRKTYTQPSAPAVFENRLQTPDVIASSQVPYHSPEISKKPKSQIPLLKTGKNSHPKSMIPVHRTGARARSANRDYHAPAV